jgi:hypothetical protein
MTLADNLLAQEIHFKEIYMRHILKLIGKIVLSSLYKLIIIGLIIGGLVVFIWITSNSDPSAYLQ